MARLQDAASQPVVSRNGRRDQQQPQSEDGDLVDNKEGLPTNGGKGYRDGDGIEPDVLRGGDGEADGSAGDNDWVEETVEHPAPEYGVDSPVIR